MSSGACLEFTSAPTSEMLLPESERQKPLTSSAWLLSECFIITTEGKLRHTNIFVVPVDSIYHNNDNTMVSLKR